MTELPSGRGQLPVADLVGSGRRYVLRSAGALHELSRWQPGQRFRHLGEALGWLRRIARDHANLPVLRQLQVELGAADRIRLSRDEGLTLLAERLVRQGWGLRELAQPLNQAVGVSQVVEEPEPESQQVQHEEEDIGGWFEVEAEEAELIAAIEVEVEDGELEATMEVEVEDGELEAFIGAVPGTQADAAPEPPAPTANGLA